MTVPQQFFDQCCPSFKKVIGELAKKIVDIESQFGVDYRIKDEQKKLACCEFYTAYYAPLEFFVHVYRMFGTDLKWFEERGLLEIYLYLHEYFDDTWRIREQDSSKFIFAWEYDFFEFCDSLHSGDIFSDERDLSYPNSLLDQFLHSYKRQTTRPVSKKLVEKYEKMKTLYTKIKAAQDDVKKWFYLLLEAGIDEFVNQVVEHRILGNLHDVKLWKLYIQHLKEANPKRMLLCYSKYCRFFLDDAEMKAEYKAELEKYGGPVSLPWTNLFDFEEAAVETLFNDSNEKLSDIVEASSDSDEIIQNVENLKVQNFVTVCTEVQRRPMKEICKGFYEKPIRKPAFSFKGPIIDYIRKNANPLVLQKLFKSNKWFFAKQPTPICYSLDWRDRWNDAKAGATYIDEKLVFKFEDGKNDFPRNIFITTVFGFNDCGSPPADYLSKEILPCIHRCEAKYIDIKKQNITFKDLILLIEHDTVYDFCMDECEIMDEDGKLVLLEKIMELLPNVGRFRLSPARCGANSGDALANMKFNEKIDEFAIGSIEGEPFDPVEFKKFLDANKAEDFYFAMCLSIHVFAAEFVRECRTIMGKEYYIDYF